MTELDLTVEVLKSDTYIIITLNPVSPYTHLS